MATTGTHQETAADPATGEQRMRRLISRISDRVASHQQKNGQKKNLATHPQASLPGLPNELVRAITDYLDMSDIACLALCNRELHCDLGTGVWEPLRIADSANEARRDLLVRLARDCPGYFYCHRCFKLQSTANVDTPRSGPFQQRLECTRDFDFCKRPIWSDITYNLGFHHLQLAMARHRRGTPNHGISLDELAVTTVSKWWHTCYLKDNHTFNAEARIVNGELCLRLQDLIVFGLKSLRRPDWDIGTVHICSHIALPRYHDYNKALACKLRRVEHCVADGCRSCDAPRQCSKCGTEFVLELRPMGSGMLALAITKWANLGRGETPLDPQWLRHLPSRSYLDYNGNMVPAEEQRSNRSAYERLAGRKVNELTEACLGLLCRRVVKEIFPLRDVWIHVGSREAGDAGAESLGPIHRSCTARSGCGPLCPNLKRGNGSKEDGRPEHRSFLGRKSR